MGCNYCENDGPLNDNDVCPKCDAQWAAETCEAEWDQDESYEEF